MEWNLLKKFKGQITEKYDKKIPEKTEQIDYVNREKISFLKKSWEWYKKKSVTGKILIPINFTIVFVVFLIGIYIALYSGLYTKLDPTVFFWDETRFKEKILQGSGPDSTNEEKGAALARSLYTRINEEELYSLFGWSVNDLIISPTHPIWMDNRASRQRGVIYAVRMLITFFSPNLSKYGDVGLENDDLLEAREKYFAYTSDSWWFPASENQYKKAIALIKKYERDLLSGAEKRGGEKIALFNLKTDDIYNSLIFITGKQFIDQPLGILVESNSNVEYSDLDDRMYYAKGIILVLRDYLKTLVYLYPEITEKGGKENINIAFKDMDQVATFDPILVTRGDHDSVWADHRGKMARYFIQIRERINDLAQSINR